MNYINSAGKALEEALKRLHYQWAEASEGWNDAVQKDFANQHMQAYDPAVRSMAKQLSAVASLIARAEREMP